MKQLPPHLKKIIVDNPTAFLTKRGIEIKRGNGQQEILSSIPNAEDDYADHFNEIRSQEVNKELIKPKDENSGDDEKQGTSPETIKEAVEKQPEDDEKPEPKQEAEVETSQEVKESSDETPTDQKQPELSAEEKKRLARLARKEARKAKMEADGVNKSDETDESDDSE